MKDRIIINRIKEGDKETLGHGTVVINGESVFRFCTLELPNLHNRTNISSIIPNTYKGEIITRSDGVREAIYLHDTPGRTSILIHVVNYYSQILGCIGVGEYFKYINGDDIVDLANSGETLEQIIKLLRGKDFVVEIKKIRV